MKIELKSKDKESIHLTINGEYVALVMYNPDSQLESGNPYTTYFGYKIHRALKTHFSSLHNERNKHNDSCV